MRLKIFLVAFFISLPFWWGVNILEKELGEILFWQQMQDSQIMLAQADQTERLRMLRPARDRAVENLEIGAGAGFSLYLNQGKEKVLFRKAEDEKLAIASLTKLMTSYIVLENYNLEREIVISKSAVREEADLGKFRVGESFRVKDLLYPLLIESSNDAAQALAEVIGEKAFVDLMNLEAQNLGLENTNFVNPTGLDPEPSNRPENYSTPNDLAKLVIHLLDKHPKIFEILALPKFDLYTPQGVFHHHLLNQNQLLGKIPGIIGGKTGYTERAKGCLLLITRAPDGGTLISVILGSGARFLEMEKLLTWIDKAYRF